MLSVGSIVKSEQQTGSIVPKLLLTAALSPGLRSNMLMALTWILYIAIIKSQLQASPLSGEAEGR